eukprot:208998-Amphidinium_carterae.3
MELDNVRPRSHRQVSGSPCPNAGCCLTWGQHVKHTLSVYSCFNLVEYVVIEVEEPARRSAWSALAVVLVEVMMLQQGTRGSRVCCWHCGCPKPKC